MADVEAGPQEFTELVDPAAERLGGAVLWATDDFFAEKDNLLKPQEAVFIDGKYTDRGKWMDGWESRRKRDYASHARPPTTTRASSASACPASCARFVVDTAYFKGNYPSACCDRGREHRRAIPTLATLLSDRDQWTPILPRSELEGRLEEPLRGRRRTQRFTHLRFNIYPDGGVARLRVHGDVMPDCPLDGLAPVAPQLVDLAAAEHGALVVACNDMFFGSRHNLIMPGRGVNMGDGWETKRSRRAGPDWVVVRLATEGTIERAIVDTLHFKGNAPDACAIDVATRARRARSRRHEGRRMDSAPRAHEPPAAHRARLRGRARARRRATAATHVASASGPTAASAGCASSAS